MKKCKNCQIGHYWHSPSERAPLYEDLKMDGMGSSFTSELTNFCSNCGHPIDKKFERHFKEMRKQEIGNVKRTRAMDNICMALFRWALKNKVAVFNKDYKHMNELEEQWWAIWRTRLLPDLKVGVSAACIQ
jgi:hypothetical protein